MTEDEMIESGGLYGLRKSGDTAPLYVYASRDEAMAHLGATWSVQSWDALRQAAARRGYVLGPADWKARERMRFERGEYTLPVWVNESWYASAPAHLRQHYAHVSQEDPSAIAFTEDPEKGRRDRQTRMRAGRYLNKFFGPDSDYPVLSKKRVAYFAEWQARGAPPPDETLAKMKLKFTATAEGFVEVYDKGPASCMSGCECVEVYAAGDLALAYLQRPDGKIVARALVWPEKKALGRVYPTPEYWSRDGFDSPDHSRATANHLHDLLKGKGYTSIYEDGSVFDGARIRKIALGNSRYRMPYLDHLRLSWGDDENFLIDSGGELSSDETGGEMRVVPTTPCDRCGEPVEDADALETVAVSVSPDGDVLETEDWCPFCRDIRTFYCDATGEYVSDSVGWVCLEGGETWARPYFEAHGFTCEYDGECYPRSQESERFPGFAACWDDDADIHPELRGDDREDESENSAAEAA